jgi:hypothetical protein
MKCVACGNQYLVEGVLTHSDGEATKFSPADDPKLKRALGMGGRKVRAYGCARCGHLQLAVDFSQEDLKRYQSFEGEHQRSIVDD